MFAYSASPLRAGMRSDCSIVTKPRSRDQKPSDCQTVARRIRMLTFGLAVCVEVRDPKDLGPRPS